MIPLRHLHGSSVFGAWDFVGVVAAGAKGIDPAELMAA
jgi:hypothetical protein